MRSRRFLRASRGVVPIAPLALAALAVAPAAACGGGGSAQHVADGGPPAGSDATVAPVRASYSGLPLPEAGPRTPVHAETVSPRADTMQLMFAAGEMQTSGEPFASGFAGRALTGYDRWYLPPDLYLVNVASSSSFFVTTKDLFGFSTAVESYEYSKYHMNMVANQSGAGVSLANGPLVASQAGATIFEKLRARVAQLITAAGTDTGGFAQLPPPVANPTNVFGFPGLWPNLAPYKSFDPAMTPSTAVIHSSTCTSVPGYGGLQVFGNNPVNLYECDYSSLHLTDRVAQTEHVIGPGILGYATWKEALWAIDFTGRLHDSIANPVNAVAPEDVAQVGRSKNMVMATDPTGAAPGVYIGSTPLEGMWGITMLDEIDNAAAWLLTSLATRDGATLSGFPSVLAATLYDYGSPLVWFPTAVSVTEDDSTLCGPLNPAACYPGVASIAVGDATSHAVDLAALSRGFALFFGMTDGRNALVGQQPGLQIAFGGNPFAADDGAADGEDSPHDRALAILRVAFVDLDRMHADPATGVVMDTATVSGSGGSVTRGTAVTTTSLGHVVVGLRHVLVACNAAVSQYGAPDADASKDAIGILNTVPMHPTAANASTSFSPRVRQVLMTQADFVLDVLTQADGTVANGATLSNGQWTLDPGATAVEAQGAALRVLTEAYFLTHTASYQDRARAVARRLLGTAFWSDPGRMFRGVANGADEVDMTAERFAWLQQALRETYEALWVPGDALLDRTVLEDRIARTNKLFLNGWDDLNGDQSVQPTTECLAGRLQLGEQALTGELGTENNSFPMGSGADRDADCVQNIAAAHVGSVLAGQVHFHSP